MDPSHILSEKEIRTILYACQSKFGLMTHQIESYNHFIHRVLPAIVRENSVVVANYPDGKHRVEFVIDNIHVNTPSNKEASGFVKEISPSEARVRGLTYSSDVEVDIEQRILRMPPENAPPTELPVLVNFKHYRHRLLCRLPVMVGSDACYLKQTGNLSGECPYDNGGYFIVNGMEKIVISQEKLRTNFPYVFQTRKNANPLPPTFGKALLTCEVRSSHEKKLRSTSTLQLHLLEARKGAPPRVIAILPYLECPLSLAWLLRMLGWDPVTGEAEEIERLTLGDMNRETICSKSKAAMRLLVRAIARSVNDEGRTVSSNDVLKALGENGTHEENQDKRDRYVRYICNSELLPHMGIDDSPTTHLAKRTYIYHMLSKMVSVLLGITQHDDRDHYANKRVDTAGPLTAHLFRQLFRSFLKTLQSQIQKSINIGKFVDLLDTRIINHKRITGGIRVAFGTGNWGTPKIAGGAGSATGQMGITQQLSQMTGISSTAHGRRLNTPLHKEGRNPLPRQLSNSAWGIVCPTETPEGLACGLVKNLAWGARVRVGTVTSDLLPVVMNTCTESSSKPLVTPLVSRAQISTTEVSSKDAVMVTVNGCIAGYCHTRSEAKILTQLLREKRRSFEISFDTTIAYIEDTWQDVLRVHADAGCLLRPVLNLEHIHKSKSVLTRFENCPHAHTELWAALCEEGVIEYIDKDEENTLRVAEKLEDTVAGSIEYERSVAQGQPYTHSDIHPSIIHGVCASLIPFSNHNQSPRNTYQSAMGKQALGVPSANYNQRLDSIMNVLVSPEKPLVATWMDDMTNSRAMPAGQNVMVAIMCHTGFNQEDSLIMCKTSVDAGMFYSLCYHTSKDETRPNGTDVEKIEVPTPDTCTRMKAASYAHLDKDTGVARVGARLTSSDVIIGKTVETTDSVPMAKGGGKTKMLRDKSQQVRSSEEGEVDRVTVSYNQEGQKIVKVRTRQLRVPQIGDKFCYTPDHDILTKRGWVSCDLVKLSDMVLTYDPIDEGARYAQVDEVHQFDLTDELMCVVNYPKGVDLTVTMNHRMYVREDADEEYSLLPVSSVLNKGDVIVNYMKASKRGLLSSSSKLPRVFTTGAEIESWLLLCGFWIGYRELQVNKESLLPQSVRDRLSYALTVCSVTGEETLEVLLGEGGGSCISAVDTLYYTTDEGLPAWALHMDGEKSAWLLDGILLANSVSKSGEGVIRLATSRLVDDLQALCIHAGSRVGDAFKVGKHEYELRIVNNESSLRVSSTHATKRYTGSVHCVTVGTGILYVRRNGKPVWCGNSSRHGQKGVVGMMRHRKDMPFTAEGLTPDIIVNPHAIPSRMTIGHLFETLLGTEAARMGEFGDGTPFRDLSVEQVAARLEENGFDRYCDTTLYCGLTGKALEGKVFYGPTYYQRLKHMVKDKMHARSRGPVAPLTRQPVEGRSKEGGLRIGEMERDACVSHGASANIRESLFERSDPYSGHVCVKCGFMCDGPGDNAPLQSKGWCNHCSSSDDVTEVLMPFACKLTLQEITGLHILPKLKFDEKEVEDPHQSENGKGTKVLKQKLSIK